MSKHILQHIEKQLNCTITHQQMVGGGCIAQTSTIKTDDGHLYFLKHGFKNDMFEKEANGLKELRQSQAIRIPEVIAVDQTFLLLEHVTQGSKSHHFFLKFGHAFAQLHRCTADHYGFYEDNYIGSTPQVNKPYEKWLDFYFNNRLLFQYQLAEKNGHADSSFKSAFRNIEKKLPNILEGSDEKPCLLHGDLWSGNYLADEYGQAVLIDPAVYYGHREADLAMTKLFGGFSPDFYTGYQEKYPLKEGYDYRENIYLLYHVLNHLNLFGTSYKQQAIQLMNSY